MPGPAVVEESNEIPRSGADKHRGVSTARDPAMADRMNPACSRGTRYISRAVPATGGKRSGNQAGKGRQGDRIEHRSRQKRLQLLVSPAGFTEAEETLYNGTRLSHRRLGPLFIKEPFFLSADSFWPCLSGTSATPGLENFTA